MRIILRFVGRADARLQLAWERLWWLPAPTLALLAGAILPMT